MTTSSDASRARLRKVSFDEAVARGKATFAEWGKPLAPAQFLERERRLLSVPWARKAVSTWFLEDESGDCLSSCETFRTESRFDGKPGVSHGIASVFTESALRGRGHAARLLELVHEKLLEPSCQAIYLFSDIDPAYYERLGFRARPAMDRVYAPEAGDPFERAQAAAIESFLGLDWSSLRGDSRFLVMPADGYLDWQLERERAYASLL
ncbi:MAG TPA: GNAT family N-acetyltransferase, partial [Bdellovibrionota bacterium]|nr:GNAT family N-acetyltransferase [Bdellovibrionota bacterium]